jgi:hypothetical protein
MKKALVVGIDDYPDPNRLNGCVNDAVEMASLLESNGDGSPNFDVRRLISNDDEITSSTLHDACVELFSGEAETALLYFAGHGVVDEGTNQGFLITPDGENPNWGVNLGAVLNLANEAHPKIKSTVILLDSCQSGFAGEVTGFGKSNIAAIGNGVTILSACHKHGYAAEANGHGKFTDLVIDGLSGAASDVLGRVTRAALYAHVDQTLGAWEQRPIYKANVQNFVTLRDVGPKISKDILRKLPDYFPSSSHVFTLDPSFEPDRGEETKSLRHIPVNEENVEIYRHLQKCNHHGIVTPTEHEHMWHSAIYGGGVRLTATGAHYRRLAELRKI